MGEVLFNFQFYVLHQFCPFRSFEMIAEQEFSRVRSFQTNTSNSEIFKRNLSFNLITQKGCSER